MFDVPGEYSQMAFTPFGAPYQLTETLFTFQGIGLGGNSQFNGMLFQTNKNVAVVDASLIPTIVPAHPVGTIMAVADRAAEILAARWT